MKKKVFLPISISFILLISFFYLLTISSIIAIICAYVYGYEEAYKPDAILVYIAVIFLAYSSIRITLTPKISLKKDLIYKNGDGDFSRGKIQYKCSVYYKDIQSIQIVASKKNSKNKNCFNFAIIKYLEFTLKNGKKLRMFINYYRRNQIKKMLYMIKKNIKEVGNDAELDIDKIMESWYSVGGYNNKNVIQK